MIARSFLNFVGVNYNHGTGHGVGHYSGVHENPPRLDRYQNAPFQIGMICSNEPGHYEDGKFGIRVENLLTVEKNKKGLLGFFALTRVPYCKKLLKMDLLSKADIEYINAYHAKCLKEISPILKKYNWIEGLKWLKNETKPIKM